MAIPFRTIAALLALPLLVSSPLAQDYNNLDLSNGSDGFFTYSDPSAAGDFWWRVFPKEVMQQPNGVLTVSGLTIQYMDTNWATPDGVPGVTHTTHDIVLAPGVRSEDVNGGGTGTNPGNIEPNFGSPLAVQIAGADITGLFANPCSFAGNPFGCSGACPPSGFVLGYVLGLDVTAGGGIPLQADGLVDWTYTTFVPPGMSLQGGSCGTGDYILQDAHSSDVFGPTVGEHQSPSAVPYSRYGGFHIGGAPGLTPDAPDEVYAGPLEFAEPICEPTNDVGFGAQTGLAALNPSSGGGVNTLGMRYWHAGAVGELAFFFASTLPLLPSPGIPIFDIHILVNIADPLAGTIAGVWAGFIAAGGAFGDDGIMDTPQIHVPATLVGFSLAIQGFNYDLVSDFDNSQAVTLAIQP